MLGCQVRAARPFLFWHAIRAFLDALCALGCNTFFRRSATLCFLALLSSAFCLSFCLRFGLVRLVFVVLVRPLLLILTSVATYAARQTIQSCDRCFAMYATVALNAVVACHTLFNDSSEPLLLSMQWQHQIRCI